MAYACCASASAIMSAVGSSAGGCRVWMFCPLHQYIPDWGHMGKISQPPPAAAFTGVKNCRPSSKATTRSCRLDHIVPAPWSSWTTVQPPQGKSWLSRQLPGTPRPAFPDLGKYCYSKLLKRTIRYSLSKAPPTFPTSRPLQQRFYWCSGPNKLSTDQILTS